jgi:hypothetical protein
MNTYVLSRGDMDWLARKGKALTNLPLERLESDIGCARCRCMVVSLSYHSSSGQLEVACPRCGLRGMLFQLAEGNTAPESIFSETLHATRATPGGTTS